MNKNLRILGTAAAALALLLSSCSSSSEEATLDTSILERLNAATGFKWEIDSPAERDEWKKEYLTEEELSEPDVYGSEGYIQQLYPTDVMKCLYDVYVFEKYELALNAKALFFNVDDWKDFKGAVVAIEDPLTNFGIILLDYGDPCSGAANLAFDVNLAPKN